MDCHVGLRPPRNDENDLSSRAKFGDPLVSNLKQTHEMFRQAQHDINCLA